MEAEKVNPLLSEALLEMLQQTLQSSREAEPHAEPHVPSESQVRYESFESYLKYLIAEMMIEQGKAEEIRFPYIESVTIPYPQFDTNGNPKLTRTSQVVPSFTRASVARRMRRETIRTIADALGDPIQAKSMVAGLRLSVVPLEVERFIDDDLLKIQSK